MFYEHIPAGVLFFFVLYGITGVVPLIAAIYLLLRRGNAIAPDTTPPLRLRRWAASFFALLPLAHVWWFLFYLYSSDQQSFSYLLLAMVDCVLLFATFAGTLLAMLQDRRRSVWPAMVGMIPFVLIWGAYVVCRSPLIRQMAAVYLVLLGLLFTAYMVVGIRQYERWLNDNYADLENKKVWLCQAVALGCMLLFVLYVLATNMVLIWLVHVIELVLVGLLLWRVETLPQLENTLVEPACSPSDPETTQATGLPLATEEPQATDLPLAAEEPQATDLPLAAEEPQEAGLPLAAEGTQEPDVATQASQPLPISSKIEQLLAERCVDTQLYLQQDLSLLQLSQAIGTNRFYLTQYFSSQGITYNTYINNLRINHFIRLYHEATAAQMPVIAQQLASASGYRSYSTFSLAFKQRMGQSVRAWMRETTE